MYITKTPAVVKALYSSLVWNMPRDKDNVYLTFDDGPHEHITDQVLTHLKSYNAKASFFCVGKNILENPSIFKRIKDEGHSVGNHSYNHENGWETSNHAYYKSLLKCQELTKTNLFRPPYGKITKHQSKIIHKRFQIIMWDVLSGDFDNAISKEKCLDNVLDNIQAGSIVVFHDSEKAGERMLFALPMVLEYIKCKNFTCKGLNFETIN